MLFNERKVKIMKFLKFGVVTIGTVGLLISGYFMGEKFRESLLELMDD